MRELPEVDTIIFRMDNVPYIDQSGLYAFEDAITDLSSIGKNIILVAVQKQPKRMFEKIRIMPGVIPYENIVGNFDAAIVRAEAIR